MSIQRQDQEDLAADLRGRVPIRVHTRRRLPHVEEWTDGFHWEVAEPTAGGAFYVIERPGEGERLHDEHDDCDDRASVWELYSRSGVRMPGQYGSPTAAQVAAESLVADLPAVDWATVTGLTESQVAIARAVIKANRGEL